MIIYHNTRQEEYRTPFGAVTVGTTVNLRLKVMEVVPDYVSVRTWIDGEGERIIPMHKDEELFFYEAEINCVNPAILWYYFIIGFNGGDRKYYGAKIGKTGGEGCISDNEPSSFQITVFRERVVPSWYKNAICYQIFPDRFARGEDYKENWEKECVSHKTGPARRLVEDWNEQVDYKKDEKGRILSWDFYGGTLRGIIDKLPYIKGLGASVIYLNPIVESASNHRYDTGDFLKVSPLLGGDEAFKELCDKAKEQGIRIILDGVYNHTGADSKYFNKYGNYDTLGAYQDDRSQYRDWYYFNNSTADGYDSWWGVGDLPTLNKDNKEYRKLVKESMKKFIDLGASGFRLDVADELSDDFIAELKSNVTDELGREGLLIGEVWEDASNKISYGVLRKYFLGTELDAVMNYPYRDGIISFLTGYSNAYDMAETVNRLQENYPPEAFYSNFNMLGSHDRMRILTALGDAPLESAISPDMRREFRLNPEKKDLAFKRLWLGLIFQMTMPGVPCIYYGDEAGLEGYSDPYNRGTYPWGMENESVMGMYKNAIDIRNMDEAFVKGTLKVFAINDEVLVIKRSLKKRSFYIVINRGLFMSYDVTLPVEYSFAEEMLTARRLLIEEGKVNLTMMPVSAAVIYTTDNEDFSKKLEDGCGVLCHVTSVPNEGSAGNIGACAYKFVDFLKEHSQKYWQILPLLPTDEHGSPYAARSSFGCNPSLLGMDEEKIRALYKCDKDNPRFNEYKEENKFWLKSYAMFLTLSREFEDAAWQTWDEGLRKYSDSLYDDVLRSREADYYAYREYLFDITWSKLKEYANANGIKIIGDIPMYVATSSADTWANPELFLLDETGYPKEVAGVPPDYFSEDGQKWGNPLYDWEKNKETGFKWFMERFERMMHLYDYTRLDHFRGYEAYFSIPVNEKAIKGMWRKSLGEEVLKAAHERYGPLPFIAEDLGFITYAVKKLMKEFDFSGMSVLQFFDGNIYDYTCKPDRIAYTGTHDNEMLYSFIKDNLVKGVVDADGCEDDAEEISDKISKEITRVFDILMDRVYESDAKVVIVPLQDAAMLDNNARMNTPGSVDRNWCWQATEADLIKAGKRLDLETEKFNRKKVEKS